MSSMTDFAQDWTDVPEEPRLHFPTLPDFVEWVATVYRRPVEHGSGLAWCPRWWCHAEAVSRLDALWRAFESLRLDPALGMASWWRDHADYQLAALTDGDGPFKGCGVTRGHAARPLPPLPLEPAPAGLFDEEA
ncbi:DUF4913 domain-containing protein [Luteipulveratus sp. YIM 133132]|uniref:DUF4913 domain-containing protein n=1 Tax=Luteipulveratus flavus TaxID=3031728 RepID=A0ABT6C3G8_9MICO|nr:MULTISPECIES: DUF4913 domain-containing protein [unclassified Luteipulveratus]MDE9366558.1 DUF4913 domain-containing protein [Luteipulveratus sp. YIM 133132]MDF8263509.1 DUF4913 domain-containing protein [Luteipulveratus sp. YIM 133296]